MASILSNEKYSLYFQKIGLLYKRPEVKASLEVILSVFTVAILIMAAIRPTLVNITSLQKKIEDQETVDKKADNKISQLLNAQGQLTTFASSLPLYDEAVPDSFSYKESALRLEYLARENGLVVDLISFAGHTLFGSENIKNEWFLKIAKPSAENILANQVNFTVSGKQENVISFLKQVENMDRLAVLDSVSFSKQVGQTKAEDSLKATGQLNFYFYIAKQ